VLVSLEAEVVDGGFETIELGELVAAFARLENAGAMRGGVLDAVFRRAVEIRGVLEALRKAGCLVRGGVGGGAGGFPVRGGGGGGGGGFILHHVVALGDDVAVLNRGHILHAYNMQARHAIRVAARAESVGAHAWMPTVNDAREAGAAIDDIINKGGSGGRGGGRGARPPGQHAVHGLRLASCLSTFMKSARGTPLATQQARREAMAMIDSET
jgi:hypothetical protein